MHPNNLLYTNKFKMAQEELQFGFGDFIKKPTNMSKHILKLALKAQNNYNHFLKPKKIKDKVKLRLLYLNKYSEIYAFIINFSKKDLPNSIEPLFWKLMTVFDYVALNNILLAYSFLTEKNKDNPILTKEDEKLLYLKKLHNKDISLKKFNDTFGHYALNAFELSSKRFSEYSKKEMIKISRLLSRFDLKKTISLKDYLKNKKKCLFAVYSTLREELKYIALLVINGLRFELMKTAKEKKIKDIFDMSYDDIRREGYC